MNELRKTSMSVRLHLWIVAMAAAAAAGLAAGPSHAQAPLPTDPKPAIYVSEFEVTDPEGIRPYSAGVEGTFLPFGGRYIVRGGPVTSLEGPPTRRIVMISFPSVSQAQAWYDSPAYRALRPIRHRTATSKVFIVEGAAP